MSYIFNHSIVSVVQYYYELTIYICQKHGNKFEMAFNAYLLTLNTR